MGWRYYVSYWSPAYFHRSFAVQQSVMGFQVSPKTAAKMPPAPKLKPMNYKTQLCGNLAHNDSQFPPPSRSKSTRWSGRWWLRFAAFFCLLFCFCPRFFLGFHDPSWRSYFSNRLKPPTTRVQESTPQKFDIDTKNGWAIFERIRDTCSKPSFWVPMLGFRSVLKITLPENG